MKEKLLLLIKKPLLWVFAIELVLAIMFFALGNRIVYAPWMINDWVAIGATGQWVGAVVAIIIPFIVAYYSYNLQKNIGQSNVDTLGEIQNIERHLNMRIDEALIKINQYSVPKDKSPEETREEVKSKALKFVNISMIAKTEAVAKHLNISKEEAFKFLEELLLHDKKISCGGRVNRDNMDNVIWTKK